jgi:hypothetical protein
VSNSLAIATVTSTLRTILNDVANNAVNGAVATFLRPDNASLPALGVNIFLYMVTINTAWRNRDLPTRTADRTLVRRPQTALDLHYLLTFHGDDADLVPQLLLGAVARQLHAEPVLGPDQIAQAVADETGSGAYGHFLQSSDLADQIELVRITPANLSLEELNKLWMTFPNADYVLSAAYVAGVVLIETGDEPPGTAPPPRAPQVKAGPVDFAVIDSVQPQPVELASPPYPTQITLIGRNLDPNGAVTFATPGGISPLAGTVQPGTGGDQLAVALPAGLHPGVNTVQLIQFAPQPASPLEAPRVLAQSNTVPFVLRPTILSIAPGSPAGQLRVQVAPLVGPGQQATLLLYQFASPAPLAFALPAQPRAAETDTLEFDVSTIPAGSIPPAVADGLGGSIPPGAYLARVRVDGAESRLDVDGSGQYSGPIVTF